MGEPPTLTLERFAKEVLEPQAEAFRARLVEEKGQAYVDWLMSPEAAYLDD